MQGDNQHKLDDDILQCRADILKALQGVESAPKADEPPTKPAQSSQTEQSPAGIRIPSFESLQTQHTPAEAPDAPAPSNRPEPVEAIENQLVGLRHELEQTQSRLQEADAAKASLGTEKEQLAERLETSCQSAEQQRLEVESLGRQLAEKIAELSTLKEHAEQTAAALTAQAQQLRQAGEEKEAAEKRLEAQTAEWAKTFKTLKAAQEEAAVVLLRRQRELDTIHVELEETRLRLEQADADKAQLTRENAELTEALHDAQYEIESDHEPAVETFDLDRQGAMLTEPEPAPYCEPVEEVISEDDVHLEQKLADKEIPAFNLAEQIMAEQRRDSASRRQGPKSAGKTPPSSSIERVMRHYVSEQNAETPPPPTAENVPPQRSRPVERTPRFLRWQGEKLSTYQQSLLDEIIQKDIRRFCGPDIHVSTTRLGCQPMDN